MLETGEEAHHMRRGSGLLWGKKAFRRAPVWIAVLVLMLGSAVAASTVNGVTITLLNSTYNRPHDITEFRYRVSGALDPSVSSWVLQIPDCIEDSTVLFANRPCSWVTEPFRGLRFDLPHVTTTYRVRLAGYWDTASTRAAVLEQATGAEPRGEGTWTLATLSGPGCSTWMSLEVVEGETIAFPPITGAGCFPAESPTLLRVTCSMDGWLLDYFTDVIVPSVADPDAVRDVLSVVYEPFAPSAGTTEVTASYELSFDDQDFLRLPSGDYQIIVVYTLIAPD